MNDQDVKQINDKLDSINQKVTLSAWEVWFNRLKYFLIGGAWVVGALTHKWGLFHFLSKLTG